VAAVLLAAHGYPDVLSFDILFPKLLKQRDARFDDEDQMRRFTNSAMLLWNLLVDCHTPAPLAFLKCKGNITVYLRERCAELLDALDVLLFAGRSDIQKYSHASQEKIQSVQAEVESFGRLLQDETELKSEDRSEVENRVTVVWQALFDITAIEAEQRKERIQAGAYQRRVIKKRVSRNDPCPCGSGKKYKYCCLN